MCLTGVDYFSTLGYQPGIAALAAGTIAPLATIVLVALTVFGALPVYRYVARTSPNGEGSIAMLERLLPRWGGKLFVLVLLGFAATDFLITMTLSAADASAHFVENPLIPASFSHHTILITLVLLGILAAVFLGGFTQAITVAVGLVGIVLALNLVVLIEVMWQILSAPHLIVDLRHAMTTEHGSPAMMIGVALIVFPKLALGLSGFETGVAVMPQIQGSPEDPPDHPRTRIAGGRRLLTTAALIMSTFLIASSLVCTILIPEDHFRPGGQANGRALAYLAHESFGSAFGTAYDLSTILILWFAGASAMAGMLNLIPRYLPRYGMALTGPAPPAPGPRLAAIAFAVTSISTPMSTLKGRVRHRRAGIDDLGIDRGDTVGAPRPRRARTLAFALIAVIFAYTTLANVIERPEGVQVASFFIAAIITVSFASRINRAFELRCRTVTFDDTATSLIDAAARTSQIHIVTHDPHERSMLEYQDKEIQQRAESHIPAAEQIIFLEVNVTDASEFSTDLEVHGRIHGGYRTSK
jgi:hypothetical protein